MPEIGSLRYTCYVDARYLAALGPLMVLAVYGTVLIGIVILIRAVVQIGQSLTQITKNLDEIAASLRSDRKLP